MSRLSHSPSWVRYCSARSLAIFAGTLFVVTCLGYDDIEGLLELVEVEFLGHHADGALELCRVLVQVVTEDIHRSAGLVHQGRENADGRGFAGAVRAEQGEEVTFGDVQIDTTQGLEPVAVGFG